MLNEMDSISNPSVMIKIESAIMIPLSKTNERFVLGIKPINFREETFFRKRMRCFRRIAKLVSNGLIN